ncbi:ZrgA family zinc uptake protein [Denitrificimonas halotolerans]|uniref:ZrgA family zinc uptake protein n=1 Tax=Denitrificimonas halotolerans TaxID=3098930 RepID=UPI0038996584
MILILKIWGQKAHQHSNIQVLYPFRCTKPEALQTIDFSAFFQAFPQMEHLHIQMISPKQQFATELSPHHSFLKCLLKLVSYLKFLNLREKNALNSPCH